MSTNKDLLLLENEFRNELPRYKEKPSITFTPKPASLRRVSEFLELSKNEKTAAPVQPKPKQEESNDISDKDRDVEMDIFITSM